MLCRWWRRPPSSGAPVISRCFARWSEPALTTSTRSSPNSCGHGCSSGAATTAGGSAMSCSAKWPPSWPHHRWLVACMHAPLARWSTRHLAVEPDWRVVAGHFEQAWHHDEAVEAYQKATISARRRGAVQEAVACLTEALGQLGRSAPGTGSGPQGNRHPAGARLSAGATQGSMSGEGPADFQRCLALASTGNYEDELLTTLHRADRLLRAAGRTAPRP